MYFEHYFHFQCSYVLCMWTLFKFPTTVKWLTLSKEHLFVCESSSGEGLHWGGSPWVLFMLFFYLEVNKDFTDCKQCLLPLLWSCLHKYISHCLRYWLFYNGCYPMAHRESQIPGFLCRNVELSLGNTHSGSFGLGNWDSASPTGP